MKYKHIIWDWNGTLLNDLSLCVTILNQSLSKRNIPAITIQAYKEKFDRAEQAYDLSTKHLAALQEEEDEARLSRDDLIMEGEDLKLDNSGEDRESLASELTQRQREEQKLREEYEVINGKLR